MAAIAWAWLSGSGAATATPASTATPTSRLTPTAAPTAVPTATTAPAISFSTSRFEADPALVAGAASTGVPNLSGEAGIIVDVGGAEVLYAKQPRKRLLIASTTKIMTAMVAVDRAPLDRIITISDAAAKIAMATLSGRLEMTVPAHVAPEREAMRRETIRLHRIEMEPWRRWANGARFSSACSTATISRSATSSGAR